MEVAKRLGTAVILVGHVTKDGSVAGPRVLEHLVDCVLLFEGERERSFRTLRALKNRFGATSEVGVFEMRAGGLVEVADPSARFVGEASRAPGSCVLCAMEGTRPLLVEVQALVAPTEIVPPRRVATGIDRNRLAMIIAVLARHGGPPLTAADVFVNVAGGVRVDEPGADLAVALALASAHRGEALSLGGREAARLLRRDRPDRRAPLRRPSGAAGGRGGQVRSPAGARPRVGRGGRRPRGSGDADRGASACQGRERGAPRRLTAGPENDPGSPPGARHGLTAPNPTSPHGIRRAARIRAVCDHG